MKDEPIVLAEEPIKVALYSGIVYFLTPCCGASGKGSDGGIVCRACYHDVDDIYGDGWTLDDARGWNRYYDLIASYLCEEETTEIFDKTFAASKDAKIK